MRTPINSMYEIDKKYRRMTESILNLVESSMSGISSISMESLAGALPEESQQVSPENCPICLVSLNDKKYQTKKTYGCKETHTFHRYCLNKLRLSQSKYTSTLSCYVCKVSVDKPKKESVKKYEGLPVANPNSQHFYLKGTSQFHEYKSNPNVDIMNDCLVNLSLAVDFGCEDAVALLGDMELIAAKYYLKKVTENVDHLDLSSMFLLSEMLTSSSTHGNKEVATHLGESEFIIGMSYLKWSKQKPEESELWSQRAIEQFENANKHGYANSLSFIGESEVELGKVQLEIGESKTWIYKLEQAIIHFERANEKGNDEAKGFICKANIAILKICLAKGKSQSDPESVETALEYFKTAIEKIGKVDVATASEAESLIAEAESLMKELTSS